ncbi:MAG: aromatic amino acid DMT transporter YddG [Pirellulales bacterium]
MRNGLDHAIRRSASGTACGIAAILLWSTTVAVARSLSEQVGPMNAAAAVYLIAGTASGLCFFKSRDRVRNLVRLPRRYLLGCGSLFVAYMLVLFLGVGVARDHRQVLEVGLLNYLWPALTILLSLYLLDRKAGFLIVPGTLVAVAGVFLVLTQSVEFSWTSFAANIANNPAAYSLGLAAACSWALYSNLTRRWAGAEPSGAVDVFLPVTGTLFLLLATVSGEEGTWKARTVAEAVFLGLVTWAAYRLWDVAMRKGDVVLVAACSYLTPLFSTIISCYYLRVAAGGRLWMGCVLIICGSLLTWWSISERAEPVGGESSA